MSHLLRNKAEDRYATSDEFRRIFNAELDGLYQLAFVLAVDPETAEQAFVAGLEDSMKSKGVFKYWASAWAKRTVIKSAIRLVHPCPNVSDDHRTLTSSDHTRRPPMDRHYGFDLSSVLSLAPFERFVFVITVLERHSEHECALLLNCVDREVRQARATAFERLANASRRISAGDAVVRQ
jgi:hypothetical protein